MTERCDVVIVGARCAGSAAACAFAQAGRRVIALDRAKFPSDTLSTHVFFPTGVDELRRMGALDRILEYDPPRLRRAAISVPGLTWYEHFRVIGGGSYGLCVPRDLQDEAMVLAARERGVDVRERCDVQGLLWSGGRVAGVRYRDADGDIREIEAALVVGADGRRSTVAALVGSWRPYRVSRNGRGLVWRYMDDPQAGEWASETMWQFRDGDSIAMAFPCAPKNRLLVLMMGAREEVAEARRDPEGYWQRKLALHKKLAERSAGATNISKPRSTHETPAFFRVSSGPGWALAGDAGHFKDPVIGQGMRDAVWMGRTLAEAAADVLDHPAELDAALRRWEYERDLECIPAYHWANSETRVRPLPDLFVSILDGLPVDDGPTLTDAYLRVRTPQEILNMPFMARAIARGVRSRGSGVLREALGELRNEFRVRAEIRARRFRPGRMIPTSEHPDAPWPDPPVVRPPQPESDEEAPAEPELVAA